MDGWTDRQTDRRMDGVAGPRLKTKVLPFPFGHVSIAVSVIYRFISRFSQLGLILLSTQFFSCRHATLQEALSIRWSFGPEGVIELKSGKTSVLVTFCVCLRLWVYAVGWGVDGVGSSCPPVRNDIVTPRHLLIHICFIFQILVLPCNWLLSGIRWAIMKVTYGSIVLLKWLSSFPHLALHVSDGSEKDLIYLSLFLFFFS